MKITLKDGSVKEYNEAKSVYDIALDISEGLARAACAGEVNGEVVDLRTVVDYEQSSNCSLFPDLLTLCSASKLRTRSEWIGLW